MQGDDDDDEDQELRTFVMVRSKYVVSD